jgi:RNA polymerase primary sigma factor
VQRNLRYVVSVAYVYKGCGVSLLDLIGEGNIGLIQAALRFDPFRNVKFITYASWWIRQAIRHALAEQSGAVRLPAKQAVLLNKINAKNKAFLQEHERVPTSEDLAKELGLSVEEVESILRAYRSHLSLNAPLKNKKEANYLELLKSKNTNSIEDNVLLDSLRYKIEEFLKELSPREEKVLRCRFGFDQKGPFTLEKIAKEMHLSRERVRQIEKKATERLRSKRKIKILKDFLN